MKRDTAIDAALVGVLGGLVVQSALQWRARSRSRSDPAVIVIEREVPAEE